MRPGNRRSVSPWLRCVASWAQASRPSTRSSSSKVGVRLLGSGLRPHSSGEPRRGDDGRLSQNQLATLTGIPQSTMSTISGIELDQVNSVSSERRSSPRLSRAIRPSWCSPDGNSTRMLQRKVRSRRPRLPSWADPRVFPPGTRADRASHPEKARDETTAAHRAIGAIAGHQRA